MFHSNIKSDVPDVPSVAYKSSIVSFLIFPSQSKMKGIHSTQLPRKTSRHHSNLAEKYMSRFFHNVIKRRVKTTLSFSKCIVHTKRVEKA